MSYMPNLALVGEEWVGMDNWDTHKMKHLAKVVVYWRFPYPAGATVYIDQA